jgi:hypothetical protein
MFPVMSIQIPSELVQAFADQSGVVRAVSYIYYNVGDFNVGDLFPQGLPGTNKYATVHNWNT